MLTSSSADIVIDGYEQSADLFGPATIDYLFRKTSRNHL